MSESLSVVIPSYNYGRFIGEAIESVLTQTRPAAEVIVVDDGSTDDTEGVVTSFGENRVRYLRQENAGVSAARNRGVAESRGDLIGFLDADDTFESEKLELQTEKLFQDANVGLVHCGIREFDSETGDTVALNTDGKAGDVADGLLVWEEPVVNVSGSCLVVRRDAFEAVGGFDTRMKCGEDWDFCYRVARKFKVGFVAEPLVNYRSHGAAAHHNVDNMERGMAMFYAKAFDTDDPKVLALKDRALGNYHKIISGSYFRAGRYGKFASHAVRSIAHRPANLGYFLSYPLRRLT